MDPVNVTSSPVDVTQNPVNVTLIYFYYIKINYLQIVNVIKQFKHKKQTV